MAVSRGRGIKRSQRGPLLCYNSTVLCATDAELDARGVDTFARGGAGRPSREERKMKGLARALIPKAKRRAPAFINLLFSPCCCCKRSCFSLRHRREARFRGSTQRAWRERCVGASTSVTRARAGFSGRASGRRQTASGHDDTAYFCSVLPLLPSSLVSRQRQTFDLPLKT